MQPGDEFQEQLRAALKSAGLTQQDLAHRLGKSGAFVSQCLAEGRNLTVGTMSDLARACGVELHIELRRPVG